MCWYRRCQAGSNVDTLALSRPPFESFLQSLQQGCMLLAEPSYLSCPAWMKAVVARGPLRVQTWYLMVPLWSSAPSYRGKAAPKVFSLMTLAMSENCIPWASSIGFRSPRSSLFSYLFSSSMSTCGVKVIFHLWYIYLCFEKPSFQVNLLETPWTRSYCSLVCRALVKESLPLSPFEPSLLSLKA
jgi:hypothetical protein